MASQDRKRRARSFFRELVKSFDGVVALVANLVGVVGVFGIAKYIVDKVRPAPSSDSLSNTWIAILIGLAVIGIVIMMVLMAFARRSKNRSDELGELLQERERRLQLLEQENLDRPFRESQRLAVEAMSTVFGYKLTEVGYHYTVYRGEGAKDGWAKAAHRVVFYSTRRTIRDWTRTVSSQLVKGDHAESATEATMSGEFKVSTMRRMISEHRVVEEFRFSPSIQKEHGEVALSFENDCRGGTFLTRKSKRVSRDFDFLSFSPREPVHILRLTVEFDGFAPEDISVDAVFGPAMRQMPRETVDVLDSLRTGKNGAKTIATLEIPWPIMGVTYRVKWSLDGHAGDDQCKPESTEQEAGASREAATGTA